MHEHDSIEKYASAPPRAEKTWKSGINLKKLASKTTSYWQDYKTLRNKITNDIRLSVQQHYKDLISQDRNDPKKMWETINKVLDKDSKSTSISQLKKSDTTIENRQEILETLNEHFVTVGPNLARKIERKQNDNPLQFLKRANLQESFKFSMVDQETMLQAIKQLKNGKAAGPDKIPTTLVKDAAEFISQPLMMIFNASLKLGVFPNIWKLAKVSPIFKTGARNNKNNYRPISVLSMFSKLIEKIVHDQLLALCSFTRY